MQTLHALFKVNSLASHARVLRLLQPCGCFEIDTETENDSHPAMLYIWDPRNRLFDSQNNAAGVQFVVHGTRPEYNFERCAGGYQIGDACPEPKLKKSSGCLKTLTLLIHFLLVNSLQPVRKCAPILRSSPALRPTCLPERKPGL